MPKHPQKVYRHNGVDYLVRDTEKAPLTETERALVYHAKPFSEHQGRHRIMAEPRQKVVPERYFVPQDGSLEGLARQFAKWRESPSELRRVLRDVTAPKSGHAAIAAQKHSGEPLLNTTGKDMQRSLLAKDDVQHRLDKKVRNVSVKAVSGLGAKIVGDWAQHEWGIYSLRYSRGVVIVNHKGDHTPSIFPTIGNALDTLRKAGLQVW